MKKKTFLGGAVFGALLVLTFAAANNGTPALEYNVRSCELPYGSSGDQYYTKALNDLATNGWEVLCSRRIDFRNIEVVLKRAKE